MFQVKLLRLNEVIIINRPNIKSSTLLHRHKYYFLLFTMQSKDIVITLGLGIKKCIETFEVIFLSLQSKGIMKFGKYMWY